MVWLKPKFLSAIGGQNLAQQAIFFHFWLKHTKLIPHVCEGINVWNPCQNSLDLPMHIKAPVDVAQKNELWISSFPWLFHVRALPLNLPVNQPLLSQVPHFLQLKHCYFFYWTTFAVKCYKDILAWSLVWFLKLYLIPTNHNKLQDTLKPITVQDCC